MLENDLPFFYAAVNRYRMACRVQVDGRSFTPNECALIMVLMHLPEVDTSGGIARRLGISPSLASRSVDTLTGLGYLEVLPDPDDRRVHHLRLTDKSQGLQQVLEQMECRFREDLFRNIPEEELQVFRRVMHRMLINLREETKDEEELKHGA